MHFELKLLLFVLICSQTIDTKSDNDLCTKGNDIIVTAAFNYGKYIGLIGNMWSASKNKYEMTVIRVMQWYGHWSDTFEYYNEAYYDPKVWDYVRIINMFKSIEYAFSSHAPIRHSAIKNQTHFEIVYFVQEPNLTTAYQFDPEKFYILSLSDSQVVYDPKKDEDNSGFFRLRNLYLFFQYQKIKYIFMYRRLGEIESEGTNQKRRHPIYYAIVYTEEEVNGRTRYYRNYMRSERQVYNDYENELSFLQWTRDENLYFCDEITRPPTGVVRIGDERESFVKDKSGDMKYLVFIIEFYGSQHQFLRITYHSIYSKEFTVDVINVGLVVDNNRVFFENCDPHPSVTDKILDYSARGLNLDTCGLRYEPTVDKVVPSKCFKKSYEKVDYRSKEMTTNREEVNNTPRIGDEDEAPWTVLISVRNQFDSTKEDYTCTGSLIAFQWVVTAADCYQKTREAYVYVGRNEPSESRRARIKRWFVHHRFDPTDANSTKRYDIALIQLVKPLHLYYADYNPDHLIINTICLPTTEFKLNEKREHFLLSGYPFISRNKVNTYSLITRTVSLDPGSSQCFDGFLYCSAINQTIYPNHWCYWDFGAPLVKKGPKTVLMAISSGRNPRVYECNDDRIEYFVPIALHLKWIAYTIEEESYD